MLEIVVCIPYIVWLVNSWSLIIDEIPNQTRMRWEECLPSIQGLLVTTQMMIFSHKTHDGASSTKRMRKISKYIECTFNQNNASHYDVGRLTYIKWDVLTLKKGRDYWEIGKILNIWIGLLSFSSLHQYVPWRWSIIWK